MIIQYIFLIQSVRTHLLLLSMFLLLLPQNGVGLKTPSTFLPGVSFHCSSSQYLRTKGQAAVPLVTIGARHWSLQLHQFTVLSLLTENLSGSITDVLSLWQPLTTDTTGQCCLEWLVALNRRSCPSLFMPKLKWAPFCLSPVYSVRVSDSEERPLESESALGFLPQRSG